MGYLIDTTILSELRKGQHANPNVLAWAQKVQNEQQGISVLSLGEIQKGILILQRNDKQQAEMLDRWLNDLITAYTSETFYRFAKKFLWNGVD